MASSPRGSPEPAPIDSGLKNNAPPYDDANLWSFIGAGEQGNNAEDELSATTPQSPYTNTTTTTTTTTNEDPAGSEDNPSIFGIGATQPEYIQNTSTIVPQEVGGAGASVPETPIGPESHTLSSEIDEDMANMMDSSLEENAVEEYLFDENAPDMTVEGTHNENWIAEADNEFLASLSRQVEGGVSVTGQPSVQDQAFDASSSAIVIPAVDNGSANRLSFSAAPGTSAAATAFPIESLEDIMNVQTAGLVGQDSRIPAPEGSQPAFPSRLDLGTSSLGMSKNGPVVQGTPSLTRNDLMHGYSAQMQNQYAGFTRGKVGNLGALAFSNMNDTIGGDELEEQEHQEAMRR